MRAVANIQTVNGVVLASTSGQARPRIRRGNSVSVEIPENGRVTVGSSKKADIHITHPKILEEHCIFEYRGGRVYCKSLTPLDEESLIPVDTNVWVNNCQLRPSVSYLVSPGANIFVGDVQSEALVAEFDEADTGADSMAKMLIKGMVSNSTVEIKSQVDKLM